MEITVNKMLKSNVRAMVESTKTTGARFASITYTNQTGETAKYNLLLGVKMESLYKHDLKKLQGMLPSLTGIDEIACKELIESIENSLKNGIGNNDKYTLKNYFQGGEVKTHGQDGYLRGYVIRKTVLKPGVYAKVNSKEKTIAKNKLEKQLKKNRIKTFKLDSIVLEALRFNKMELINH